MPAPQAHVTSNGQAAVRHWSLNTAFAFADSLKRHACSETSWLLCSGRCIRAHLEEDPYTLVCLEAAALEKPYVCFEGAGGSPEFVEEDCGFVVP